MSGSIGSLCRRVEEIQKSLGGSENDGTAGLDDFALTKKHCAELSKQIRTMVDERESLLQGFLKPSKETVELAAKIRKNMTSLKESATRLEEIAQRDRRNYEKKPSLLGASNRPSLSAVEEREEMAKLVWQHVQQCEGLVNPRKSQPSGAQSARVPLMTGNTVVSRPLETDLQSIDDDDVREGLTVLKKRDKLIDDGLDSISKGLGRLKNIALDMKEEISVQNVMLDEIDNQIETATDKLAMLNSSLKKSLDEAGGASRIILNTILFIILIALGAFCYHTFQGSNGKIL